MTAISNRLFQYLKQNEVESPSLLVDLSRVSENFDAIVKAFPNTEIYYAVKCNPAPLILKKLVHRKAEFDAAGLNEIKQCLAAGASPENIVFGNTIKKQKDIEGAYGLGIRKFAFDSSGELHKLAAAAPGASVVCRVLVDNAGAAWPLSGKFGCAPDMARDLMLEAKNRGLHPLGLSFHVGSQQTQISAWEYAIDRAAAVFRELAPHDVVPELLNLGGGFPVPYRDDVPDIELIASGIGTTIKRAFGNRPPKIAIEPGRFITADAGVIRAEVVLVSQKRYDENLRWVFLDVGRFGGLAETEGEAIEYPIQTPASGAPLGPVVLAGPTCDGADILYQNADYQLPLDLKPGDEIHLLNTGAYTSSYATAGFNGFEPLNEIYI